MISSKGCVSSCLAIIHNKYGCLSHFSINSFSILLFKVTGGLRFLQYDLKSFSASSSSKFSKENSLTQTISIFFCDVHIIFSFGLNPRVAV
eukprot:UN06986